MVHSHKRIFRLQMKTAGCELILQVQVNVLFYYIKCTTALNPGLITTNLHLTFKLHKIEINIRYKVSFFHRYYSPKHYDHPNVIIKLVNS